MNQTNELTALLAKRSMTQDPMLVALLDEKIKAIEAKLTEDVRMLDPGMLLQKRIEAALPTADCKSIINAFEHTDSLVAFRAVNSVVFNMLNSVYFADLRYATAAASMGRYVGERRGWAGQERSDIENPEDKLLRLQDEVQQLVDELPRWVKAAFELEAHCVSENKAMQSNDIIPTPTSVYTKVTAKSEANQARWEAERKTVKAGQPSLLAVIG